MNRITKMLIALLGMATAMGYTIYNFTAGKIDLTFLLVCALVLGYPFLNILNLLIQELKNK